MNDEQKIFIDGLYTDEFRSGYLVTSDKKKLWNVQINLINEVARICEKYNIRWFAIGGTLLGAARHGGFIPWDDDVDIAMLRPDYARFQEVAAKEVHEPYFLDVWYNYRLESEGASLSDSEGDFQFITTEQENNHPLRYISQSMILRIRDNRTMFLILPDRNYINHGIFVDICPIDPVPPFPIKSQTEIFNIASVLAVAAAAPKRFEFLLQNGQISQGDYNKWRDFLALPYRKRGKIFDKFMLDHFFQSERVGDLKDYCLMTECRYYLARDFEGVTYLPFEKIELPAPAGYESILDTFYGDWHEPVLTHMHSLLYSADISYKEYFKK